MTLDTLVSPPFAAACRTQVMIIYAICMREMSTRFVHSRFGYLLAIVEPTLMISFLYLVRYYLHGIHTRHGIPLVLFITTGFMVWYAFRKGLMEASNATQQRDPMLRYPQVTVLDTIMGRFILGWLTWTCVMIILSTAAVVLVRANLPNNIFEMLIAFFMAMWLGTASGVLVGVGARYFPILNYIVSGLMRTGMWLSGALYTADELPKWLQPYVAWNPVFHIAELMRQAWLPSYVSPIANPVYATVTTIIITAVALSAERITRHVKIT